MAAIDSQLSIELAVCAKHCVSHSEFLAWPAPDQDSAIRWYLREAQTGPDSVTRLAEWEPRQDDDPPRES